MVSQEEDHKLDLQQLIDAFQVSAINPFNNYLFQIWKDLSHRSEEKHKGINKIAFSKYYDLPGLISDRLFAVFDKNNNNYLDPKEFIEGMIILFTEPFNQLAKFIFNFYDFDKDHIITKEDVKIVLAYVPLQNKALNEESFDDKINTQNEVFNITQCAFGDQTEMNEQEFIDVVENKCSEIFLCVLMFILLKRPFNHETIKLYEAMENSNVINTSMTTKITSMRSNGSKKKSPLYLSQKIAVPILLTNLIPTELICDENSQYELTITQLDKVDDAYKNEIKDEVIHQIEDNNVSTTHILQDSDGLSMKMGHTNKIIPDKIRKTSFDELFLKDSPQISNLKYEGVLFKITKSHSIKRLWFKLICRDFFYFKHEYDSVHQGMHNLSGVYIKENKAEIINKQKYFSFSVIYSQKTRVYYCDNELEFKLWLERLRQAIDYTNLTDLYEIKNKIGNGKFGMVKLGVHKITNKTVAIKIMNKKNMNLQDLELVKTEIDILRVCQHPYIIKLYDVYENFDYIYIIMEYCGGSDLFSYLDKRHYMLPERRTADIVHKMCAALYYLHSYGIVHRDLKPENILMTDTSDTADIRLVDFGLSKIIGPNEKCKEPFGTIGYVAPEVLLQMPYDKSVDLWSMGIITFLLLCGSLPFNNESENETANLTVIAPAYFDHNQWDKISPEAKRFVDSLLQKKPEKRLTIKQALEHEWLCKYYHLVSEKRKQCRKDLGSHFKIYTTVLHDPNA